jgi:hypothetical protein
MGGIKFSTGTVSNTIKLGNFVVANDKVKYGSTEEAGFWTTIDVPSGGYVIYGDKATQGPSIYAPANDTELITITNALSGQNFTTASECFTWLSTQSGIIMKNREVPGIVTSGLILSLDSGFLNSYPTTGLTWSDISGVGNNAKLINGPTFDSGNGGTIILDGTNDYIDFPSMTTSSLGLNTSNGASICCWINLKLLSRWTGVFAFWLTNNVCDFGWDIQPNNILRTWKNSSSYTGFDVDGSPSFTPYADKWVYFVLVSNSTNLLFYANGKLIESRTVSGNLDTTSNSKLTLGDHWDDPAQMKTSIVQIYNRALSAAEVLQNYQATYTRFFGDQILADGLVLHLDAGYTQSYPGTGSVWSDLSGNSNHVTLYNGVSYENGALVGDGVNDYGRTTNTLNLSGLTAITIIVVCKVPTTTTNSLIYEHTSNYNSFNDYGNVRYGGFGFAINTNGNSAVENYGHFQLIGNNGQAASNAPLPTTSNYQQYTTVYDFSKAGGTGDNETTVYINGSKPTQVPYGSNNTQTFVNDYFYLWSRGGSSFFQASISQLLIYNRALSEPEIQKNYLAIKSRYGL